MTQEQTASVEDYLEAIAILNKQEGRARVTQLSKLLGVTKPSVSGALKKLSEDGLVKHERYGYAVLTARGMRIAEDVMHRHEVLSRFLGEILGIDPEIAKTDACKMEHSLSQASLHRLEKFVEFVLTCPRGEPEWMRSFDYYFEHGERSEESVARCQRQDV